MSEPVSQPTTTLSEETLDKWLAIDADDVGCWDIPQILGRLIAEVRRLRVENEQQARVMAAAKAWRAAYASYDLTDNYFGSMCLNLRDAVDALSIPPVIEQQPETTTLVLNKYQRDNLLSVLLAVAGSGGPSPMSAGNTGDWVMETVAALGWNPDDESTNGKPNSSHTVIANAANQRWGRNW